MRKMSQKILLSLGWLVLSGVLLQLAVAFQETCPAGNILCGILLGMTITKLFASLQDILDTTTWKTSQRKLERGGLIKKDSPIRISFAYLFRIMVDGKYFLVKNARGTEMFQPVGGVYKMHDAEAQYLRQQFYAADDNSIPMDRSSKGDYRLRLKNRYLRKFVKRFDRTQDRETIRNLSREFREELVSTGILKGSEFDLLAYIECGRHFSELHFSEHFQCYELLMADIVELQLTAAQEEKFRELMEIRSTKYYFATSDEIESLGVKIGTEDLRATIGNHTKKILVEHTDDLIPPKKKARQEVDTRGSA